MADPRAERGAYLASVADRLHLPEDVSRDVIDELDSHLEGSIGSLIDEGLSPAQAERESIARLGDPGELAAGIGRAHQTRRRLFVAAGYGVWAATTGALWGLLFAIGVVTLGLVLAFLAIRTVVLTAGLSISGFGETWTTWSLVAYSAIAGYVGGSRVPPVIAARSRRRLEDLTRPVAFLGGLVVASIVVFVVRVDLDPGALVALLTIPLGFAAGASRAARSAQTGRVRLANRTVVGIVLGVTVLLTVDGLTSLRPASFMSTTWGDTSRIGPPASEVLGTATVEGSSSWASGGPYRLALVVEPSEALAGWSDIRAETWPAIDQVGVDPAVTDPTLIVPVWSTSAGVFEVTLDTPRDKAGRPHVAVVTGVAPDGTRYVLKDPDGPIASSWHGTIWDYLTTP